MATVVLNLYSWNFPTITNRIRMSVFLQTDPQAFVASQIDAVSGHPERVWSFPGLPRENYGVVLDEIDGADAVVRRLAYFDVVPSELETEICRDDEQIQVDAALSGLVAGANTATFDGTGGVPDYRGWSIVASELTGRGIMVKTYLDYSWDSVTGVFTLLQAGDVFSSGTWYNIHFNCQSTSAGNSVPTIFDFGIRVINANTVLTSADFGKKLIVDPGAILITVTLPSIVTVPQGRRLMVDISNSSARSVRVIPAGADTINFLNGNIYACPNESFTIYRLIVSPGVSEWRVCDCDGNFKTVGQVIGDDSVALQVWNKKLLDGSIEDANRYARLYNEVVLNLPLGQAVLFADWGTGNNKYYYSLTNGSGQFHFPDRRNRFEKNTGIANSAGDFDQQQIGPHTHFTVKSKSPGFSGGLELTSLLTVIDRNDSGSTSAYILHGEATTADVGQTSDGGGTENKPDSYLINKYVLV